MLKVQILHPDAKAPTVEHPGQDLGYDLYAAEDAVLKPGCVTRINTGIAIEFTPSWIGGLIRDRSSMAAKGIVTSGGVVDAGYRGPIIIMLTLETDSPLTYEVEHYFMPVKGILRGYKIKAGDKIAQLVPVSANTSQEVRVVDELSSTQRACRGFGSSGR